MWQGEVVSVHVAPAAGAPMKTLDIACALPGRGLEGDRYAEEVGTYSKRLGAQRQVTLIEAEVLERIRADHGIDLAPGSCRRNIVTRGVPLGHLVGKRFRVGEATLRGVRLNEPCMYFENLVGLKGVMEALLHRSGLNAEVLEGGAIRPGDAVRAE